MPEPVTPERLTPEQEAAYRAAPARRARVRDVTSVTPEAVARARWRGLMLGASIAAGAAVATVVGWCWWGRRTPRRG